MMFAIFGFSVFFYLFGAASATFSEKCASGALLDEKNRDGVIPTFPLQEDPRLKPSNILKAHEILRIGLQQFLEFREEDLGFYLNHMVVVKKPTFNDEYGQEIRSYNKVFKFIWTQYNETLCQNYATDQYDIDILDLCSVARFLSHQTTVKDRGTIMKRIGDALGYKCHPCTPYKRKEFGGTVVPNTEDIGPIEDISPEQILVLCKDYDHHGQRVMASSTEPPTTSTQVPAEINGTIAKPNLSPFDYTPCNYSNGVVVCDEVPLTEVQRVFERTSFPRLISVTLTLQPYILSETFIPKDVFGSKISYELVIKYPFESIVNGSLSLQIDTDAFRSTKSYTTNVTISSIDCTLLDLSFLSGFEKLTQLVFGNMYNIQHCLPTLPPLPRLTTLYISICTGMNELASFPTLTNGLKDVTFIGSLNNLLYLFPAVQQSNYHESYNDKTVDRIMGWLLQSSAITLEGMSIIGMNQVTRVPNKIASFKALNNVWLSDNNISTIKSGAFSFSVPVDFLFLLGNGIIEIEPGAFQGDFKNAYVAVFNNSLTRFEESTFGSMLKQMESGKGGIDTSSDNGNPIDCSERSICHLAWLRRYIAFENVGLNCANGTLFEDLQPAGFNHCP